ncbi:MAG: aminotransferase class III-fold pyridoxal phosphate-dependent enzyme [Gammaproteobacteria bacterium]|nr:aminotransferase class III-fold pyridoxal phosphate-dependent enzyme [Gammaproteobacteria bacterium]
MASRYDAYWMPFTANRAFKRAPRVIRSAQGHYYLDTEGRQLLDGFSGLWTSGLGHCHPAIVAAVQRQVATLDYALAFQAGHERVFELANAVVGLAPSGFTRVFFTNSGSEAVDTALKIALAFHRARGAGTRTRFIGRERAYHGVNFGGMSVGGIPPNRKAFAGAMLPGASHVRHTHSLAEMAFSRGQPQWGAHLAEDLERHILLHDPANVAAFIVEPVAGSTGVLVPPVGYLERIREICTRHGVLLIFDEVITAFGRVGAAFAAERFNVMPDLITIAKGLTNGVVPMGAVLVREEIYDALMQGPEGAIEFFHGYTYSGHPLAAAAGLATLETYARERSFEAARAREARFAEHLHALRGEPHVIDIRNFGLMGGIDLAPRPDAPGARGMDVFLHCWEHGVVVRSSGDTLAVAPFFATTDEEFARIFAALRAALRAVR